MIGYRKKLSTKNAQKWCNWIWLNLIGQKGSSKTMFIKTFFIKFNMIGQKSSKHAKSDIIGQKSIMQHV